MPRASATSGAFAALLALCCSLAAAQAPDRRIAITIDDLPWQRIGEAGIITVL